MTDSVRRYGVRRIDMHWWRELQCTLEKCEPVHLASDYDHLSARLAASEAEVARWRNEARNHRDTLLGIESMDPATEAARIKLWCSDALSGYTEPVEVTTKKMQDEYNSLRDKLAKLWEYAQHGYYCDIEVYKVSHNSGNSRRCTCGLAALQSSEKGL